MSPSLSFALGAVALLLGLTATSAYASSSAPTADPTAKEGPWISVYDAGETVIEQRQLRDTRFHQMPIEVRGVLALPAGEGPFPIIVFIHGNYPFCDAPLIGDEPDRYPCPSRYDRRQYEGFANLASGLAARGYLTLVPDMAPEYTNGFGMPGFGDRAIAIVDAHLDALADGTGMPFDVNGKVDLERLVIAGHSRGGPLAVRYLTDDGAEHAPLALALVTPAYIESRSESVVPRDLPTGLVVATCDGDVGTSQPNQYLQGQLFPDRAGLTVVYTIGGGTHNAVSTTLEADRSTECSADEVMDAQRQRELEIRFLADFFDMARALG